MLKQKQINKAYLLDDKYCVVGFLLLQHGMNSFQELNKVVVSVPIRHNYGHPLPWLTALGFPMTP